MTTHQSAGYSSAQAPSTVESAWQRTGFVLVWLLAFLIPWGDMVLLPYEVQASRVFTLAASVIVAGTVWMGHRIKRLATPHWLLLVFITFAAATCFWTAEPERGVRRTLSYCQLFLDAWLMYQCVNSLRQYRQLVLAYVLGAYVAFAGIIYNFLQGVYQGDGRYTAPGFDPNDLACTLILGIPLAWYYSCTGLKGALLTRLYIPCAVSGALLTASRGALVTMAVCMIFPLISLPRISVRAIGAMIVVAAASAAVTAVLWEDISVQRLATIGEQLSTRDLNGRVDIWQKGFDAFLENPVAGVGAGNFGAAVGARRSRELAAHNTPFGILVEHGLVGLFFFAGAFATLFLKVWRGRSIECRMWSVLLTGWAVAASTLSWENRELTWLLWGLCAAVPALAPVSSAGGPVWRPQSPLVSAKTRYA